MITWVKKLLWVVRNFEAVQTTAGKALAAAQQAKNDAADVAKLVHDRTTVHMDLSPGGRDPNVVILVGSYRGHDFVQVYSFQAQDFESLVEQVRAGARQGIIGRVDAPPSLRAVLKRDFEF